MKKWKTIVSLTGMSAIVAPMCLVSCSSEGKLPVVTSGATNGTSPNVSITPQYQINISDMHNKLPIYSYASLTDEAQKLHDNSEWVGGIEYHAASSAIAFIRNLAESYGYSTLSDPTTKLSAREEFLQKNNYKLTNDVEAQKILASKTNSNDELGLPGVTIKTSAVLTLQQKRKVLLSIGKDGGMANDKNDSINFTSGHLENYNLLSANPQFGSSQFTAYPDYRTKKTNVEIYSEDAKMIRQIDVPDIVDPYPILSDDQLIEWAPIMKYLLNKFLTIYQGNEDMAIASAHIASEVVDQLSFLVQKNLIPSNDKNGNTIFTFKLDDTKFLEHLKMLNNGSTHWLALKTILCGIDSTFTNKDLILFTGDKFWPASNIATKQGINDMSSIIDLMNWGGKGRLDLDSMDALFGYNPKNDLALIKIDADHSYPATFVAGKTVDELYQINGIDQATRDNITQKVADFYTSNNY